MVAVFFAAFAAFSLVALFLIWVWWKPRPSPAPSQSEQPGPMSAVASEEDVPDELPNILHLPIRVTLMPVLVAKAAPARLDTTEEIKKGDEVIVPVKPSRPDGLTQKTVVFGCFKRHGREMVRLSSPSPLGRPFSRLRTNVRKA